MDLDQSRRARFVAYFEGPPLRGDRAALLKKTGYTKGRVTQLFNADEPFGEKAARNLALRLGLKEEAFLTLPDPPNEALALHPVAREMSPKSLYADPTKRTRVLVRSRTRPTPSGEITMQLETNGGTVEAVAAGPLSYAVRIEGDALYPALRHGMFLVCDPASPCMPGEWVLIETLEGATLIRELVFDREDEITTLSLIGAHRETLARKDVRKMDAVVSIAFNSRWHPG